MDNDKRANPYDLDSDGDGITDTREAGFADTDNNGKIDGTFNTKGWSVTVAALGSLTLPNTDGTGNPNYLDIDSDDDGIPDNIEGQPTATYKLPTYIDTDNDGIDDVYDTNIGVFGGKGITPNDNDYDGTPDYMDLDTDNDGIPDIVEGNDFNFNNLRDDNVTLTGVDTDGDGLDDRFDNNNSSPKGTSAYMGTNGSFTGDPSPGSITVVQRTFYYSLNERDWRYVLFILDVNYLDFSGSLDNNKASLKWVVTSDKIITQFDVERSTDGIHFYKVATVKGISTLCNATPFNNTDDITGVNEENVFYRIKATSADQTYVYSKIIDLSTSQKFIIQISPNPANNFVNISVHASTSETLNIKVLNATGQTVLTQAQQLVAGSNSFSLTNAGILRNGVYIVQSSLADKVYQQKLIIRK